MPSEQFTFQGMQAAIDASPADNPRAEQTLIEEERYLDRQHERQVRLEELVSLKETNKTLAQNNIERKKFARWIFVLTCLWATSIFVLIFFVGFQLMKISDSIIITLISSTTINFFGFFFLVVKYLFNTGSSMPKELSQRESAE